MNYVQATTAAIMHRPSHTQWLPAAAHRQPRCPLLTTACKKWGGRQARPCDPAQAPRQVAPRTECLHGTGVEQRHLRTGYSSEVAGAAGRCRTGAAMSPTALPQPPACFWILKEPPLVDAALRRRAQQERHRGHQHQNREGQAAGVGNERGTVKHSELGSPLQGWPEAAHCRSVHSYFPSHTWPLEAGPSLAGTRHRSRRAAGPWPGLPGKTRRPAAAALLCRSAAPALPLAADRPDLVLQAGWAAAVPPRPRWPLPLLAGASCAFAPTAIGSDAQPSAG